MINMTNNPITTLLVVHMDDDRALISGSCRSTGRRLFIRLSLFDAY